MIVFRGRGLWVYISLLASVVYTSRCSYLYDGKGVRATLPECWAGLTVCRGLGFIILGKVLEN